MVLLKGLIPSRLRAVLAVGTPELLGVAQNEVFAGVGQRARQLLGLYHCARLSNGEMNCGLL